ncbi:MAG: ClpXP protease specificity-enhancing factor SspB [Gammaproteobacteria bacterium]|nr:ClpXP protease specificity-enhancing factor SspB [Gammaproteobacteria bacterium]
MLSNKPYLVEAFYKWIVDNKCVPLLLLDATQSRCKVPAEFVTEGQVTFNISPEAVRDFSVNKSGIQFRASFSGIVHLISAPLTAVLALYAQEDTQQGIFFEPEAELPEQSAPEWQPDFSSAPPPSTTSTTDKKKVSYLQLVE